MNGNRPIALFCCNRIAPTLELAHAVRALSESEKIRPMVILGSQALRDQLPPNLFADIPVVVFTEVLRRPFAIDFPRLWGAAARAFRLLGLNTFADYCLTTRNIIQGEIVLERLQKDYHIKIILISDDRSLGSEFGVVRAAKESGLLTVAVPFALSDPVADTIRRIGRSEFEINKGSFVSRFIKRRYHKKNPNNCRTSSDGQELMFLTLGQALALDHGGSRFSVPWAYGGGSTEIACVYGSAIRDLQVDLGVSAEKLHVTGQCSMDILFKIKSEKEEIRKSLERVGEIETDRPVIICALPQFVEHGMLSAEDHASVIDNLVSDLTSTGANVLLSLHPRANPRNYIGAAKKYGAVISQRRLLDIIPVASVFVATASSTLRWSVLLGVPTIVLDYFSVGPGRMFRSDCFQIVNSPTQLRGVIPSALYNTERRNEMISIMNDIAPTIDPFDGKNSVRFKRLIESVNE